MELSYGKRVCFITQGIHPFAGIDDEDLLTGKIMV
jgi:hypothetical protein